MQICLETFLSTLECDVAVIGLGPGGASAAAVAARAGLSVCGVDRKVRAGHPIQCAEFVPALLDAGDEILLKAGVQTIDKMLTYVEAEDADTKEHFPGHMIDRERFDEKLVAAAIKEGARCEFGINVREISSSGDILLSNGDTIRAKIIVGADGPRSMVGRAIGCSNQDIVETRQVALPLLEPHSATDIYLSGEITGGYGWMFPKGEIANVGLGVVAEERHRLKLLLDELVERIAATGQVGRNVLGFTGGAIPVGGMIEPVGQLAEIPVFLVGDAAGLTNPITGAGISAAVMSGKMAGAALVSQLNGEEEAGADYAEDLEDLFGVSLRRAVARRRQLMDHIAHEGAAGPEQLRGSWIAYDEYWRAETGRA